MYFTVLKIELKNIVNLSACSQVFLESTNIFLKLGFTWMKNVHILGNVHFVLPPKFPIILKRCTNPTRLASQFLNTNAKDSSRIHNWQHQSGP